MPEWNELVICTVKRVSPFAAWCSLEEYSNLDGMIHISEVAGKWVRDIKKFVKPNKQYVAKVVKIYKEKNLIGLSLKRVSRQEEKEKWNEYRKEQRAEKILEQAAKELGKNLEQAYDEIGFMLQEKFDELSIAFEKIRKSPEILSKLNVTKDWSDVLISTIQKSFVEKEVLLKAEVELKSYTSDGIERIKNLLEELKEKTNVEIKYISAPKYRIELKTKNPKHDGKNFKLQLNRLIDRTKQLEVEGNYKFLE